MGWPRGNLLETKILGGMAKGRGAKTQFFFHKMVNARHRRNVIGRIKINGEWVMEETEVSTKTVNYFKLLLLKSVGV